MTQPMLSVSPESGFGLSGGISLMCSCSNSAANDRGGGLSPGTLLNKSSGGVGGWIPSSLRALLT